MSFLNRILISLILVLPTQALSHELWLEPQQFQAGNGDEVKIEVRNGQDFRGVDLAWFDPRISRAVTAQDGNISAYKGLPADRPAITVTPVDGLMTVAYMSKLSTLTYDSWEKVLRFAEHKDFPWFEARHAERGLPEDRVTEGYWRFSKTLIAGGTGEGADLDIGMETEFVALTNPYTDEGPIRVQLLYQGAPRADAQVEMWDMVGNNVEKTFHRTDEQGIVALPVQPGHIYMIDAVVLREPASEAALEKGVMWESLWANMTFAVPE